MGRKLTGARCLLAALAAFLFLTPAAAAAADYAVTGTTSSNASISSGSAPAQGTATSSTTSAVSTPSVASSATDTTATPVPSPAVATSASASVALSPRARYLAARARYLAVRRADRAAAIVRIAKRYLQRPYVFGATGPWAFDCIGLVRFVYRRAGIGGLVGPWQTVQGTLRYFRNRHEASRHAPRVGDLAVYGHGSHIGIYIGHGRVISALVVGVRIHGVFDLTTSFTTYLHVNL